MPTNHGGELKIYFGVERITKWQGGTVAYATSVKSLPAILSSARHHGLENYPDFYSVNSAEATQILDAADDIIRYMAYGPLSIANPEQITDDPKSVQDGRRYPRPADRAGLQHQGRPPADAGLRVDERRGRDRQASVARRSTTCSRH